jgi:hypothetical protein
MAAAFALATFFGLQRSGRAAEACMTDTSSKYVAEGENKNIEPEHSSEEYDNQAEDPENRGRQNKNG